MTVPTGLTKAYLQLVEMKAVDGKVTVGAAQGEIPFQFNPKDFQVEKTAEWKVNPKPSASSPPIEYRGPNPSAMTLEMFLDASETSGGDVSKDVQKLMDSCIPTETSKAKNRPLPPGVRFGWDKVYFVGYLEKVTAKYTLFRSNGTPIRATCTLSMKELPKDKPPSQNPTSGGLSTLARRQVLAGDSLAGIAYQEYGDPNFWRAIAEANGIDDPLSVFPGVYLLIPSIMEAAVR